MNWNRKIEADGSPVWSGSDAIYDLHIQQRGGHHYIVGFFCVVLALGVGWGGPLIVASIAASPFNGRTAQIIFDTISFAALITAPLAGWWMWQKVFGTANKLDPFICRNWVLKGSAEDLEYKAEAFSQPLDPLEVSRDGSSWKVRLADVVRVETGFTREWQAVRKYQGGPLGQTLTQRVPEVEVQTFLFMADGTRRVFYTANADREGANALALSVRSWIEARKAEVAPQAAAARSEGFAL